MGFVCLVLLRNSFLKPLLLDTEKLKNKKTCFFIHVKFVGLLESDDLR